MIPGLPLPHPIDPLPGGFAQAFNQLPGVVLKVAKVVQMEFGPIER